MRQGLEPPSVLGLERGLSPPPCSVETALGAHWSGALCVLTSVSMGTPRYGRPEAKLGLEGSGSLHQPPQHYQAPQRCARTPLISCRKGEGAAIINAIKRQALRCVERPRRQAEEARGCSRGCHCGVPPASQAEPGPLLGPRRPAAPFSNGLLRFKTSSRLFLEQFPICRTAG